MGLFQKCLYFLLVKLKQSGMVQTTRNFECFNKKIGFFKTIFEKAMTPFWKTFLYLKQLFNPKIFIPSYHLSVFHRSIARIDGGGGAEPPTVDLLDPKSGLFNLTPLTPIQKSQFLTHFVAKSGPFGRLGGRFVAPLHRPWLGALFSKKKKKKKKKKNVSPTRAITKLKVHQKWQNQS